MSAPQTPIGMMTHILNLKNHHHGGVPSFSPLHMWMAHDSPKQFPQFKMSHELVHRNFSTKVNDFGGDKTNRDDNDNKQQPNQVQSLQDKYNEFLSNSCKKRKKRRKRRRRNKKKSNPEQPKQDECKTTWRQRQLSSTSDDSICFESCGSSIPTLCSESSDDDDDLTTTEDVDSCDSSLVIPFKKVRFAENSKLCRTFRMVTWSYAHQKARKGPWEEYARDRERFKRRIEETDRKLAPIFDSGHRSRIFNERFI